MFRDEIEVRILVARERNGDNGIVPQQVGDDAIAEIARGGSVPRVFVQAPPQHIRMPCLVPSHNLGIEVRSQ